MTVRPRVPVLDHAGMGIHCSKAGPGSTTDAKEQATNIKRAVCRNERVDVRVWIGRPIHHLTGGIDRGEVVPRCTRDLVKRAAYVDDAIQNGEGRNNKIR